YIGKANTKDIQDNPISKYTGVIGKEGLERYYNDFLQGELGKQRVKVTALNEEIEVLEETQIEYNNNLYLSIDLDLQKSMDAAFAGQNGAAVVLDIDNGEILAAGSYPEYDINEFPSGISTEKWEALLNDPYKPLYNKLIYGAYPPGSVIKMGVGLSFLQNNIIDENTVIPTPEFIEIGNRKFRDWRKGGHGSANFMYSIKRSVDVYYYKLSLQAGIEKIAKTLDGFGIGQKTGIDLPAEMAGILPTPEWKRRRHKQSWQMGDTLNTSIGQGYMLTTPMQIARYTAALASGKLVTPHLVMRKGNEELTFETKETLSIQKSKLNAARLGMFQVCNEAGGTGYARALKAKVTLACKTGTAQVTGISQADKARIAEEDMDYFHRSHAWFTAFVPFEKPKYAITVLIEHGMHGSSAGDTTVLLANALFDLGYIEPQYRKK
ncbi:MAG: penicillin-binding protein 2, partial [Helicobacter sp.]|nr:penicillin-binding protein 2 [Helicobacter sp.]